MPIKWVWNKIFEKKFFVSFISWKSLTYMKKKKTNSEMVTFITSWFLPGFYRYWLLIASVAELSNHVLEIISDDAIFVHHYTLLLHLFFIAILLLNHPLFGILFPICHHCIILTWCCVVLLTDTSLSLYW